MLVNDRFDFFVINDLISEFKGIYPFSFIRQQVADFEIVAEILAGFQFLRSRLE